MRWLYLILFLLLALFWWGTRQSTKETNWSEFNEKMLQQRDVLKVDIVNNEEVWVYIKPASLSKEMYKDIAKGVFGSANAGPHYHFRIGSVEVFTQQLEAAQAGFAPEDKVAVEYSKRDNWWTTILAWIFPLILLVIFWVFVMGRMANTMGGTGSSIYSFGKSKAVLFEKGDISPITFKDVAGYEEAKTEIMEIVAFLKNPQFFTRLGARIPKGILLVGPSGTGKTLMAKAVAGEAGVPFFSLSGSEFVEMFVGVGASRVRDLFDRAMEKTPCIIFIDEIDTIGRVRGKAASYQVNDERESTLNQLLAEMDGFAPNTGVIVMAATNRADILDPALLRPGRFDRHIYLELPNKAEREAIFRVHLQPLTLDVNIDAGFLAAQTPGFSGADIANVCNEAALIAARAKKDKIEMADFYGAVDRIVAGLEKKTKIITPKEKKVISYHEAGHALVGWMLEHVDPLVKVSIIPRGKSLGSAWYLPEEHQILTKSQLFERLCVMLAGRAAESLVFNEVSSGALDDLEKATKQAYVMIAELGMSERMKNLSFYDSTGMHDAMLQKPYSEETARLIDEEVRKLFDTAFDKTTAILKEHRSKLENLAELLLQKEVVEKDELEKILGKRPDVSVAAGEN
ncbi:MAG: ATP-dependent zinc metalloprotease FtsH [Haliscomenobacteraceae bacterium CHB4]|nr:ATP-dependent zinc metalloprotease FtsH [Haliscomenobacteraceae bacterium CHB4]